MIAWAFFIAFVYGAVLTVLVVDVAESRRRRRVLRSIERLRREGHR